MGNVSNRYDFALLFDVTDGNPNGDPDAGNLPRVDPETGHGLVSDVCLKRKIRNYIVMSKASQPGYDIFIKEKAVLNTLIDKARADIGLDAKAEADEEPDPGVKSKSGKKATGKRGSSA